VYKIVNKIHVIDLKEMKQRLRTECVGQAACWHCGSHSSVASL